MTNVGTRYIKVVRRIRVVTFVAIIVILRGALLQVVRVGFDSQRVGGGGGNLSLGRNLNGNRRELRTRMQYARSILAMRRFALIVEDFLGGRSGVGTPRQGPASHRDRVVKVLALKLNNGDIGYRA